MGQKIPGHWPIRNIKYYLFQQKKVTPSLDSTIEADFEISVTGREFPLYGDTYKATVLIGGKEIEVQNPALLKDTAVLLAKTVGRSGPGRSWRMKN